VCGQPIYRFGWHADLWDSGSNKNAAWNCACVIAWQFWNAPSTQVRLLRRLQARRCGETGDRLWRSAEVDHRIPLFQVWSEHRAAPWPELLGYWGLPNLQVINRDSHVAQCATEARGRHASRPPVLRQAAGLFQNGLSSSGGRRVTSKLAERKLVECDCGWSPTACHCRGIGK
jgi:hypothetical protein